MKEYVKYGFWGKKRPAVGAKGAVINMIINRWMTFPFVDMTRLDSDGKYHTLYMLSYIIYVIYHISYMLGVHNINNHVHV